MAEKKRARPTRAASVGVGDLERSILEQARVDEPLSLREPQEIVPVQRAAEALAVEHRIVAYGHGQPPIGIDVGEEELAAWLEQAVDAREDRVLVGRQIHDTVRDDHVEAARLEIEILEALDIALQEPHVVEAEDLGVVGTVALRDEELLGRHVDADDRTAGPHELGERVDVATGAAAEIEHAAALEQRRTNQSAAVVAAEHFRVDAGEQRLEPLRHLAGVAAGAGLEIGRALQLAAVVILDDVVHFASVAPGVGSVQVQSSRRREVLHWPRAGRRLRHGLEGRGRDFGLDRRAHRRDRRASQSALDRPVRIHVDPLEPVDGCCKGCCHVDRRHQPVQEPGRHRVVGPVHLTGRYRPAQPCRMQATASQFEREARCRDPDRDFVEPDPVLPVDAETRDRS